VTFYFNNYTQQIAMGDMAMRDFPGRTHRFVQVPVCPQDLENQKKKTKKNCEKRGI
jgi:hypothetical protein